MNISSLNRNVVKITHDGSKITIDVNGNILNRDGTITTFKYYMFGYGNFMASLKRYQTIIYDSQNILTNANIANLF